MIKIALAGATSGIGLAIRQELDAQHTHEYVLLVRKPRPDDGNAIAVDYTSVEELEKALSAASVHTVISCLSIADEASGLAQLNLIKASEQSSSVKRILPSEFGGDYNEG
jgi:putative NADH-flavin reductase